MLYRIVKLELRKILFQSSFLIALLLILLMSFYNTINVKNNADRDEERWKETISKKTTEKNELEVLYAKSNQDQKEEINQQIELLRLDELQSEYLKTPFQMVVQGGKSIYSLLIMVLLVSSIFSNEYTYNTASLLFSSKITRKQLVVSKIIVIAIMALLVNALFMVMNYLFGMCFFHDGGGAQYAVQYVCYTLTRDMTILQYVMLLFLHLTIITFIFGLVLFMISTLSEYALIASGVGLFTWLIAMFVIRLWDTKWALAKYLPLSYIEYPLFTHYQDKYSISYLYPVLILSCTIMVLSLAIMAYIRRKQL